MSFSVPTGLQFQAFPSFCLFISLKQDDFDQHENLYSVSFHVCSVDPARFLFMNLIKYTSAQKTLSAYYTVNVLNVLHWLPAEFRIYLKILLLSYKALPGPGPSPLRALLTPSTPIRTQRSLGAGLFVVPSGSG